MLLFHIDIKITAIDSKNTVHKTSYDATSEHTHALLFAVDPLEAAHFAKARLEKYHPEDRRRRKEPHP